MLLSREDLGDLGVSSVGHRLQLLRAVSELCAPHAVACGSPGGGAEAAAAAAAAGSSSSYSSSYSSPVKGGGGNGQPPWGSRRTLF